MTKPPLLLSAPFCAALALATLSACNNKPEVVDTNPDPMKNVLANAAPVEMPPAIKADKTLRCKDNSLVYVTFFEGDKMAVVKTKQDGAPTQLTAPKTGGPLTAAGGWKLTGSPSAIELTQPGKGEQSCKA